MNTPKLSILTPAIWSRTPPRYDHPDIEHLVVFDNRRRSIGLKRQACLDIARGDYIAFVDDDDAITDDYLEEILAAIETTQADVITFDQLAVVNGEHARINMAHGQADEAFIGSPSATDCPVVKRGAWHVCVWKRELVKDCLFPDSNYGEDLVWAQQARTRVRTHHHIPRVLHEYHHSTATTAAPPEL
jgi:glycosyltransferase involved in cell wall biosynthesis